LAAILSPLLFFLVAIVCLIAGAGGDSPGLEMRNGRWVAPGGQARVVWDTSAFSGTEDADGRLVLSDGPSHGLFAIVAAETARDCVQRAALEIGTAPGVTFFDLSLADRPATDSAATAGLFQFSQSGLQQIAYVECRGLRPVPGGKFLEIRIISPAEIWPESIERWSSVLMDIETNAGGNECGLVQESVRVRTVES
jgi:hypothetical protein